MVRDDRQLRAVALSALLLSLMAAGCSASTTPSPVANASPSPVASASPSPTTTPAPSAAAQPIPDGTYVGPTLQVADLIALIDADTLLTAAQKTDLIDNALEIKGHTTFAISLDLQGGQYTQGQSVDGGPFGVGSRGTYAFPDGQTLTLQENLGFLSTFRVTSTGEGVTLRHLGPLADEVDAVITKIFWDSGPFTLVP